MKNDLLYYSAIVIIRVMNALPRNLALALGGFAGELWYLLGNRDREIACSQMQRVLNLPPKTLKASVRACFETMGKNLVDILRMGNWSAEYIGSIVEIEGLEHFDAAYKRGKGIICLTGHIGNFELLAAAFSCYKGYKIAVIGRELYDKRFDKMLVDQREKFNIENIPTTTSIKAILKSLKAGRALGVLMDQDSTRVSGYFVDFFGKKAITAAGPMFIARKTGAPVVPIAIYRKPDDRYLVRVLPELKLEWTDNKDDDIKKALQKCNRALEELILYDPLQWIWVHDRWRTRPPDEKEVAA